MNHLLPLTPLERKKLLALLDGASCCSPVAAAIYEKLKTPSVSTPHSVRHSCSAYPELVPTRPSGFVSQPGANGKILIAGWDQPVVMLVEGKDLDTLRMLTQRVG